MNNLTIRNARIIFKNLSGKATQYSPAGRRSFSVIIDDETFAETLKNDGWNIKPLRKRDPDEPQHYHLPVAVFYGNYPPAITLISGNTKTMLDESTVQMIDWAEIKKVDLVVRPREYTVSGRTGIKAYLKTMYLTIEEDELAAEYADIGENHLEEDPPF